MKYFTVEELCESDTAKRYGIDNMPQDEQTHNNLVMLIENILDPLREAFGAPVIVNSGYRGPQLNKKVGGAKSSQHLTGQAADIRVARDGKHSNKELYMLIKELGLPFDQLIWEYGDNNNPAWVHVSYDPSRNRHQELRIS